MDSKSFLNFLLKRIIFLICNIVKWNIKALILLGTYFVYQGEYEK